MRPPRLCLYVIGSPPPAIAAAHGRFEDWFGALVADAPVELEPVDGLAARLPGRLDAYDGFVITGSSASMTEPEPWMEAAVELVRHAYGSRTPLLGVCFGHQVIGAAFGGSVTVNPNGWELSTYDVELTEAGRADPLFDGVAPRFAANHAHRDAIDPTTLSPMNGVQVLAGNPTTPVQAVAAGPAVRGVQFHPEFSGAVTAAYVDERAGLLAADADRRGDPDGMPQHRRQRAADCEVGAAIMGNFLRHWILG